MGAETSILENCEWSETYQNGPWEIENGRLSNDDEISSFKLPPKDRQRDGNLRMLTKQLKSLRHPYILHYVGFEETGSGPCLITEKVVPLEILLPKMSSTEICAGLQNVLEGLEFLHDRAKICHNNLHTGCLYVSGDGSWRLGGLEHACQFTAVTQQLLNASKNLREEETMTPEELEDRLVTDVEYGHARDIYAFGVMTESLLERMVDLGDLTKTFELRIQDECLNNDPKLRPKVSSLLQDRLFSNDFLEIASFLKHVALKSEIERKEFFRSLPQKLRSLPEKLIGQRLVPSLLSRFVMLDPTATENVIPRLLVPRSVEESGKIDGKGDEDKPLLDKTVFKQYVIPRLVKMFSVKDYHIHMTLLKYFEYFVHLVDVEALEFDVFPQVLLGLRDTSNEIAAHSLHALAEMVPILGRDVIIGGQSKSFFKEALPKKNTTSHGPINNVKPVSPNKKGKVLLKDLAKYNENHMDEDKDIKHKEREKKREEMKKRREERKKARDKVQQKNKEIRSKPNEEASKSSAESVISSISKHIPESHEVNDQSNDHGLHSTNMKKDINQSPEISDGDTNPTSDFPIQHSDTESFTAEITDGKNEWDDWNDKGDTSIESDYSDEIERELRNMKVESESSPLHVTDTSAKHSGKGSKSALKLVPKRTKSADKQEVDHNAAISEIEMSVQNYSSKYQSVISASNKARQQTTRKKDLGSEFDIKTIDIKVQEVGEDPFDFFADMAPTIKSKNVSDVLKDGGKNLDEAGLENLSSNTTTKLSFEVVGSTTEVTEEGGDWGDDDW